MLPLAGELVMATESTTGAVVVPSTLWPEALAMAWLPRPRAALAAVAVRMVPPFSVSASAAMPIPSLSTSAAIAR